MTSFSQLRPRLCGPLAGLLAALTLLCISANVAPAEEEASMRTEDVVRMLVRGLPAEEIIAAIRTRPALFDVSPDMQEELRLAGVSDEVIQAMADRMVELNPEPVAAEDSGAEAQETVVTEPALRVWLDPQREEDKPSILRVKGVVDFRLRQAWQLDAAAEETPFEDLALYLVCRAATHVPDHWRSKSPMGRDFISMPRHRMLLFLTATEGNLEASEDGTLELELPPSLEIDLLPGESHDLSLGIALQATGRYMRWTDDTWDELLLDPDGSEIRAEIIGGREGQITELEVRFNRNPAPATAE